MSLKEQGHPESLAYNSLAEDKTEFRKPWNRKCTEWLVEQYLVPGDVSGSQTSDSQKAFATMFITDLFKIRLIGLWFLHGASKIEI